MVRTNSSLWYRWPIKIVDLPIKDGDFPVRYVNVYQRIIIPQEIVDRISTHAALHALHGLRSACERQASYTLW